VSNVALKISEQTYQLLADRAREMHQAPDDLADQLLRSQVVPTEHPYVERREGVLGGRPVLRGTRIPVWLVAAMWKGGDRLEEIGQAYPHVEPAALYDAIGYYLDHQQEVEAEIAENRIERVLADTGTSMDKRGVIALPENNA
jgi:uncharacterized protein (DUF433 family)